MYYFYIVRCKDDSLYSGQTSNLKRRIIEHNSNTTRSAKYLRGKTPVKLVYFERFRSLQKAMKREAEVKKFTKAKKEELIRIK